MFFPPVYTLRCNRWYITFYSCFQDILTDFSVEAEKIPLDGGDADWFGHKVCETSDACGT